jgi:integrase
MKDWTLKQVLAVKPRRTEDGRIKPARKSIGPNLILIVPNEHTRHLAFRYTRPSTKRVTEHGLGRLGDITLAEAHEKRDELRRLVRKGGDPVEAKRDAKIEARQVIDKGRTFEFVAKEFITLQERKYRSPISTKNLERVLLTHAKELCGMAIADVGVEHVKKALHPVWVKSPDLARRTLTAVGQLFDYAKASNLNVIDRSAWRAIAKHHFQPARGPKKHHAAVDYQRAPAFVLDLRAAQALGDALSPAVIEFILLTACRVYEAVGMQWSEIDWEQRVWTLPLERTKTDREDEHRVPLSDRALMLLIRQRGPAMGEEPDPHAYVWPNHNGKRHITGKAVYMYLTRTMQVRATVHGFRATFSTWAGNETHFDRVTCELALSHKAGDAVELAYRRGDALAKRRALMDAWAAYCESASGAVQPG